MTGQGETGQYDLFQPDSGGPPGSLARGTRPPDGRLRRLLMLACAALVAFAGTVWGLVHVESRSDRENASLQAVEVVEQQLDALKRGDLEAAYRQFSDRYRHEVPFQLFHDLVVAHWAIFRTRQVTFDPGEQFANSILLHTHILASDGRSYEADFILRRARGRWWIDDVHWSEPSDEHGFIRIGARVARGGCSGEFTSPRGGT
jgi:Domain of unknown function (DUF4864)